MSRNHLSLLRGPLVRGGLALGLIIAAERPLAAYADPGTGALLWQVLVAGFVGAMFYLRKVTSWLRSKRRGAKD